MCVTAYFSSKIKSNMKHQILFLAFILVAVYSIAQINVPRNANRFVYQEVEYGETIDTSYITVFCDGNIIEIQSSRPDGELIDGYATEVAKNEFTEQAEIVDQTGRFDIVKLVKGFKSLPESVMVKKGFIYPWFENSVRAAELKARMLAFPMAIVLIISAVSLVYLLFVTAKAIGRFFRFIAGKLDDVKQKKLRKEYEKRRSQTV